MQKHSYLVAFSTAFILFVAWACNKGPEATTNNPAPAPTTPANPAPKPVVEYVNANLSGRVLEQSGEPVNGALVQAGTVFATTDINGQFSFNNIQFNKNAAYVTVSKSGFFTGSKTFSIGDAGSSNYAAVELIPETQVGQFPASSGGTIVLDNTSLNFPGNGWVDPANGNPYSGNVTVFAHYLDPSSTDFADLMPGRLTGISTDSSEKSLQSYGILLIEIKGSSGQLLQIASGSMATVTFPLPGSLASKAPSAISLWYFDETKGYWVEQGTASLKGNTYEGTVSHFSGWSIDVSFPRIGFHTEVENAAGSPVSGAKIYIRNADDQSIIYADGFTDVTGNALYFVPANTHLVIDVYDRCTNLVLAQAFQTSTSDFDLGIVRTNILSVPVTFAGRVTDCAGGMLANGLVNVFIDGAFTTASFTNGQFSVTLERCNSNPTNAEITVIDPTNNLQDTAMLQNVTSGNTDSLNLTTCAPQDVYIYYTINGVNYSFTLADCSFFQRPALGSGEYIQADGPNGFCYFLLPDTLALNSDQTGSTIYAYGYDTTRYNNTNHFTLTEFDPAGTGYIAGSFNGYVRDKLNQIAIFGRFRVRRVQ